MQSPHFSTPNSPTESTNQFNSECDGCGQFLRLTYWCEPCKSAICAACVLDNHVNHPIDPYQKASRDSKIVLDKFRARMRKEISEFEAMKKENERFEKEIVAKIDTDLCKMTKRAEEADKLCEKLKRAKIELEKLIREPLNGKSMCERRHKAMAARALIDSLSKRQSSIVKQVQSALTVVEEVYGGAWEIKV